MEREEQHLRELSIQFLVCTGSKTSAFYLHLRDSGSPVMLCILRFNLCSVSVLKHGTCCSLLQTMRNKPFYFSEQTLSGAILQSPLLSVCEQGHALLTTCATPFNLTTAACYAGTWAGGVTFPSFTMSPSPSYRQTA